MALTDCHAYAMARVRMPPGRSVPLYREALLKGTLTRLRLGAKAMSRQTSLQRTEHQSPECHHKFTSVKTTPKPKPDLTQNRPLKNPLFSGAAPAMPKTKLKNNG